VAVADAVAAMHQQIDSSAGDTLRPKSIACRSPPICQRYVKRLSKPCTARNGCRSGDHTREQLRLNLPIYAREIAWRIVGTIQRAYFGRVTGYTKVLIRESNFRIAENSLGSITENLIHLYTTEVFTMLEYRLKILGSFEYSHSPKIATSTGRKILVIFIPRAMPPWGRRARRGAPEDSRRAGPPIAVRR
jgi:hypothetical protein